MTAIDILLGMIAGAIFGGAVMINRSLNGIWEAIEELKKRENEE